MKDRPSSSANDTSHLRDQRRRDGVRLVAESLDIQPEVTNLVGGRVSPSLPAVGEGFVVVEVEVFAASVERDVELGQFDEPTAVGECLFAPRIDREVIVASQAVAPDAE